MTALAVLATPDPRLAPRRYPHVEARVRLVRPIAGGPPVGTLGTIAALRNLGNAGARELVVIFDGRHFGCAVLRAEVEPL